MEVMPWLHQVSVASVSCCLSRRVLVSVLHVFLSSCFYLIHFFPYFILYHVPLLLKLYFFSIFSYIFLFTFPSNLLFFWGERISFRLQLLYFPDVLVWCFSLLSLSPYFPTFFVWRMSVVFLLLINFSFPSRGKFPDSLAWGNNFWGEFYIIFYPFLQTCARRCSMGARKETGGKWGGSERSFFVWGERERGNLYSSLMLWWWMFWWRPCCDAMKQLYVMM